MGRTAEKGHANQRIGTGGRSQLQEKKGSSNARNRSRASLP